MIALFKHAKNFVSNNLARPQFQGICFDGERAMVTNTHVVVIVNNMPFAKQIVHHKTGEKIEGNFPNVDKIIPQETEFNTEFTDIDQFIKALKVVILLAPKGDHGPLCSLEGNYLSSKSENMIFTANLTGTILDKPNHQTFFNGKYLYDILMFFKDCQVSTVTIGFNGPLAPFKLTTDKDVLAVITPIRVN